MLGMAHVAFSQDLPKTLRSKVLFIYADTVRLDTLSIVPGSVKIINASGLLEKSHNFYFDYISSSFIISENADLYVGKFFTFEYRVFPDDFSKPLFHKDTMLILNNYNKTTITQVYQAKNPDNFFEDDQLDKNGSISRGFVIGNQRDLGTISNFNLQLSGKLNEEVSILAAVSDNNMPIQPEGNTQQLQEFDKVNILFYTKKSGIELGDIGLSKPSGYFLNLKKQTRGLRAYADFNTQNKNKPAIHSEFSTGLAKGKYNRQLFNGIEGNQGPYKLLVNNFESFIIILSGSEKIYLNGKLLTRGEQFDYVIDYNTSEITFTANQPITKDSRIVTEYEYSQQYYPRIQFLQTNHLQTRKANFWFNTFFEKDNKNDPLSESYNDDTKLFLSMLGDSVDNAFAPNIRNVGFSADKILYRLKDSIVGVELFDSIYVYSTDAEQAIYQLGFSYVGEQLGNYKPITSTANGKVFEWVAPVNGIRQGSYEPVSLFVTPKRLMMTNLGGEFQFGSQSKAGFEFALSNFDANTYSSLDKSNDIGYAMKMHWKQGLLKSDTSLVNMYLFADMQLVNQNFHPVENYYETEFERNWNLTEQKKTWQELNYNLGFHFSKKDLGIITGRAMLMQRAGSYKGQKALFSALLGKKGFRIESNVSYLNTIDQIYATNYLKHLIILSRHFKYLVFGVSEESEENRWQQKGLDSLSANSFKFREYAIFTKSADSLRNNFFVNYKFRSDYIPFGKNFREWNQAQTAQGGFQLIKQAGINFKTILTYRKLNMEDTINRLKVSEEYISGREEMNLRFLKGSIVLSGFYETGSGLEIKKQFQFIEVQNGQGQYTWIDYNQNNIKETDEFEPAKFSDQANFLMVFIPGDQYLRVYTTQFSQTIFIQPERYWNTSSGFKSFLSLLTNQFAFQLMQKSDTPDFIPDISDNSNLITNYYLFRNNLAYRGKNRKLQLEYLYDINNSKNLLIGGTDYKTLINNSLKIRYRLNKKINIYNTAISSQTRFESEFFNWKNYKINTRSNELKLEVQAVESLVSGVSYKYTGKENLFGNEKANLQEFKYSAIYEMSLKTNLQADFSYITTLYEGESATSIEYEMLDGLKKGRNMLWTLSYNQKLSKFLFLNITYFGRSSEKNPIVHNGGIQLRANF